MPAPGKLTIETPEQIPLEYALASGGSRFLAVAIDTLLQIGLFVVIGLLALAASMLFRAGGRETATWMLALLFLAGFIVYYGYFAAFEAIWSGQTPGKKIAGLRVITVSGRPITAFDSIIRNLLRIVDQLPGIYAVGLVSVFLTSKNQRLGDLAAGTVVVHEQVLRHEQPRVVTTTGAVRLGAARLQPNEIEALETFLARREDLPPWRRMRTAVDLTKHVRSRLGLADDQHTSDEALLEELVAEYRSRGRRR